MLEYMNIHVNDKENKSFYIRLSLSESNGGYWVETGTGKGGLYVTWCARESGIEPNIKYGEIKEGDKLSTLLEHLLTSFARGQKRFPADYKEEKRIMGAPNDSFELDYRLLGRVNTHHVYGKLSTMPERIWVILNLLADIGIITDEQLWNLEVT